jgi:ankyrin repeat protein
LAAYNAPGCVAVPKILIDAGASVNVLDMHGESPFTLAYKNKNLELLKVLFSF